MRHVARQLQPQPTAVGHARRVDAGGVHGVRCAQAVQQIADKLQVLPIGGLGIGRAFPRFAFTFGVDHDCSVAAVFAPCGAKARVFGHAGGRFLVSVECHDQRSGFPVRCGFRHLDVGSAAFASRSHPNARGVSRSRGIEDGALAVRGSRHGSDIGLFVLWHARDGLVGLGIALWLCRHQLLFQISR